MRRVLYNSISISRFLSCCYIGLQFDEASHRLTCFGGATRMVLVFDPFVGIQICRSEPLVCCCEVFFSCKNYIERKNNRFVMVRNSTQRTRGKFQLLMMLWLIIVGFVIIIIIRREGSTCHAGLVCRVQSADKSKFKLLHFDKGENRGLNLALQILRGSMKH